MHYISFSVLQLEFAPIFSALVAMCFVASIFFMKKDIAVLYRKGGKLNKFLAIFTAIFLVSAFAALALMARIIFAV